LPTSRLWAQSRNRERWLTGTSSFPKRRGAETLPPFGGMAHEFLQILEKLHDARTDFVIVREEDG
jgi:hypothetical protein